MFELHSICSCFLASFLSASAIPDPAAIADWPPDVPIAAKPEGIAARVPRSVRAMPVSDGSWRVRFQIEDRSADRMRLAGSFNGWNPAAHEMTRDEVGRWSVMVPLQDAHQAGMR